MSIAALSVFIFGINLIFIGFTILFVPEMMFAILMYPTASDIISRLFGMIIILLAYHYIRAALDEEEMGKFFM